ncbi:uncharacterized protein ColSpa_10835 [Colletotrichum spaethianum]|uniref:Uncharacterized protein n=1 Tax=Colletotrichum spaethianum TaxID=700344 RepID=A0AA37UK04_9PEZI|nr:uncharacterized protein ColSpa_10835 [Colletotrichum spaethianum]GKT50654.1 hypothetical protein ColSpa_10835 [Colletotrichum spaethianum]
MATHPAFRLYPVLSCISVFILVATDKLVPFMKTFNTPTTDVARLIPLSFTILPCSVAKDATFNFLTSLLADIGSRDGDNAHQASYEQSSLIVRQSRIR